ncbi:hypothetical protein [Aureimonas sp. D3]|uniref:hypothetical protein n=1 Tax=Aureimonas sp. D3 TaxID=1638164 RepID=UPI00078287CB|nr:hypothetical protein [Aureimonas sp. D3]
MTAVNVVFAKDRVYLLTDGAGYTQLGMPIGFVQKAITVPSLHAVISSQGQAAGIGLAAQILSTNFKDFDHLTDDIERKLYAEYRLHCEQFSGVPITPFRLLIAGWSKADNCPKGFAFDSTNETGEMFSWLDNNPGGWAIIPALSDEEESNLVAQNVMTPGGVDFVGRFNPIRHGIPLMEAQRRMPMAPLTSETGEGVSIIGGYILCSEINAEGITQKIIHRWKDDVGRMIEPDAFQAPTGATKIVPPRHLNREQRRAWERQHGKIVA